MKASFVRRPHLLRLGGAALVALLWLGSLPLLAGTQKTFPAGFVVCVFDRPGTITNRGSKLVIQVQDPRTGRWSGLPSKDEPASRQWSRAFVEAGSSMDDLHDGDVLTIKQSVTIGFGNFKGGEINVEFSVAPKQIERLPHAPDANPKS